MAYPVAAVRGRVVLAAAGAAGYIDALPDVGETPVFDWDLADFENLYTDNGSTLVSADGDPIYLCNDKGSAGVDQVQATEANRPLYKVNVVNGHAAALFNNANSRKLVATGNTTWKTTFIVAKWDLATSGSYAGLLDWVGNQGWVRNGGGSDWYNQGQWHPYQNGMLNVATIPDGQWVVFSNYIDTTPNTPRTVTVNLGIAPGNGCFGGYIGRAIGYLGSLNTTKHNAIGSYLAARYGLTWTPTGALPSTDA